MGYTPPVGPGTADFRSPWLNETGYAAQYNQKLTAPTGNLQPAGYNNNGAPTIPGAWGGTYEVNYNQTYCPTDLSSQLASLACQYNQFREPQFIAKTNELYMCIFYGTQSESANPNASAMTLIDFDVKVHI